MCLMLMVSLIAGCGAEGQAITGQIKIDDAAMSLQPKQVVKVSLVPADSDVFDQMSPSDRSGLITTVGRDGSFTFESVPPGRYWASVADFPMFPHGDRLATHFRKEPQSIELDLTVATTVDLSLKREWYGKRTRDR